MVVTDQHELGGDYIDVRDVDLCMKICEYTATHNKTVLECLRLLNVDCCGKYAVIYKLEI